MILKQEIELQLLILARFIVQTEQRRRTEAARKAAEAAAEAKQEADIAAYHARLREQEADKQHQHSLGRDDQPAGRLGYNKV